MAFTDNCDLFASVHEDGINLVISHIMRQRPSLFNYATDLVSRNPTLWCNQVQFVPDVVKYRNLIFQPVVPIPLLGLDSPPVGLNWEVQITSATVDLHPSNLITLPAELSPPLADQRFAFQIRICGTILCPTDDQVSSVQPTPPPDPNQPAQPPPPPPVILAGTPQCVCLDVFAVGHIELTQLFGKTVLLGKVDDIDIVDIKPDQLEDNIRCYLKVWARLFLLEKLTIFLDRPFLQFPLFKFSNVKIDLPPNPPIAHDPAVEDDQLKIFLDVGVTS